MFASVFHYFVLQMYCYYKCSVAVPHGAVGWSAVSDCGILDHANLLLIARNLMEKSIGLKRVYHYKIRSSSQARCSSGYVETKVQSFTCLFSWEF